MLTSDSGRQRIQIRIVLNQLFELESDWNRSSKILRKIYIV